MLNRVLRHFYAQVQGVGSGSWSLADWMRWCGRSKADTSSIWVRRETGYTVPLIVTASGREGRAKGLVFPFPHSKNHPPWFNHLSSLDYHIPLSLLRTNSLAPFDTLLISNHLLISLLRHLGTQSQMERGNDTLWLL